MKWNNESKKKIDQVYIGIKVMVVVMVVVVVVLVMHNEQSYLTHSVRIVCTNDVMIELIVHDLLIEDYVL